MIRFAIDRVRRDCIIGWAYDDSFIGTDLKLEIFDGTKKIASGYANKFRSDLFFSPSLDGVKNGFFSFEIMFSVPSSKNEILLSIVNKSNNDRINEKVILPKVVENEDIIKSVIYDFIDNDIKKCKFYERVNIINNRHWQNSLDCAANLALVYNLLEDKKSKSIFKWFIKFRLFAWSLIDNSDLWDPSAWTRAHNIIKGGDVTPKKWDKIADINNLLRYENDRISFKFDHYRIPKIFDIKPGDYVVDAGAYDGFSSVLFAEKCGNDGRVFAFEPIDEYYQRLIKMKKLSGMNNIVPIKKALFDSTTRVKMTKDEGGSVISDFDGEIETIGLDDYVKQNSIDKIDFIKIDVESSEMKLLEGARDSIKTFKPKMAVAIYHKANDLYDLPLFIKKLNPEYKFYIRHHSFNTMELVLYCV